MKQFPPSTIRLSWLLALAVVTAAPAFANNHPRKAANQQARPGLVSKPDKKAEATRAPEPAKQAHLNTLFTEEEEIVGEFDRSQFSRQDLRPGMVFEYQARIKAPGLTTVSIDLLTPQYPTDEEMLDASKGLRVDFSKF